MIDWFGVASNGLWVLGLAIALAGLSYTDWRRRVDEPRVGLRQALGQPRFQALFGLGMTLFCAGLALSVGAWWQIAGWALLALAFAWLAFSSWRKARRTQ